MFDALLICNYWDHQLSILLGSSGKKKKFWLLVWLSSLSIDISYIFRYTCAPPRVLHPSPSLFLYLSRHQYVAALMPMISLNILLHAEKKNPFSQRRPDWHPQILMVNKPISAVLSIAMRSVHVDHLPAFERSAGHNTLHRIPHDCYNDASIGILKSEVPLPEEYVQLLHF